MVATGLRREVAQLLTKARGRAVELAKQTGDGVLIYFIEMSILEVLAQQADVMEENGLLNVEEEIRVVGHG
jgi:hypothetical protein